MGNAAYKERKFDEAAENLVEEPSEDTDPDEEDQPASKALALKVNPDGSVEQEDAVR